MKQLVFFLTLGVLIFLFSSCEDVYQTFHTIDFEDILLGEAGYYDGSDKSGQLENGSFVKYIRSSFAVLVNEYAESEWGDRKSVV